MRNMYIQSSKSSVKTICPSKKHIDTRHKKNSTGITQYICKLACFEVSSKGFLSTRNHSTLNTLNKFIKPDITKSQFKSKISALS